MTVNSGADSALTLQTAWAWTSGCLKLTKPKLLSLVLFTTLVGFHTANRGPIPIRLLLHTLVGTALIAGGATALNMYRERKLDALMKRTAFRPLAAGRLPSGPALIFALALSAGGLAYLLVRINPLTGLLAALVFTCYLFLYTPLKTKTWLSTFVGAVPGALPVVMGWTAASGSVATGAWILFAIVFLWQLPHFYAIGWLHREDYVNAGFPVLSVIDPNGQKTGRLTVSFVAVLLVFTLLPFLWDFAGRVYLAGAVI